MISYVCDYLLIFVFVYFYLKKKTVPVDFILAKPHVATLLHNTCVQTVKKFKFFRCYQLTHEFRINFREQTNVTITVHGSDSHKRLTVHFSSSYDAFACNCSKKDGKF